MAEKTRKQRKNGATPHPNGHFLRGPKLGAGTHRGENQKSKIAIFVKKQAKKRPFSIIR